MTTHTDELLPCPLCGFAFLIGQEPHDNGSLGGKFYLYHKYGPIGSAARSCPIENYIGRHFDTREQAITAWNYKNPKREPVAWECKDYADGWIRFETFREAIEYKDETGCAFRPVFAALQQAPE